MALGEALHASLPIRALSRLAHWLTIWIDPLAELSWASVAAVLRILGISRIRTAEQSEDEVLQLMDEGLESGAFDHAEKEMVEGVLALDQRGHGDSEWARDVDYSNHTMSLDAEAFIAALGTEVDYVVCIFYHVQIVLYYQHCVASVNEALKH